MEVFKDFLNYLLTDESAGFLDYVVLVIMIIVFCFFLTQLWLLISIVSKRVSIFFDTYRRRKG